MEKSYLDTYKAMINEMHATVGRIIGIHVLLLVVEHAYWKTGQKYNETKMILFSEAGISLEPLEKLEPERAGLIAHDFFMVIVETLGRLVGSQMVSQLMNELKLNNLH